MDEQKNFLDYEGLTSYDNNIKKYIEDALSQLKEEIVNSSSQETDDGQEASNGN